MADLDRTLRRLAVIGLVVAMAGCATPAKPSPRTPVPHLRRAGDDVEPARTRPARTSPHCPPAESPIGVAGTPRRRRRSCRLREPTRIAIAQLRRGRPLGAVARSVAAACGSPPQPLQRRHRPAGAQHRHGRLGGCAGAVTVVARRCCRHRPDIVVPLAACCTGGTACVSLLATLRRPWIEWLFTRANGIIDIIDGPWITGAAPSTARTTATPSSPRSAPRHRGDPATSPHRFGNTATGSPSPRPPDPHVRATICATSW